MAINPPPPPPTTVDDYGYVTFVGIVRRTDDGMFVTHRGIEGPWRLDLPTPLSPALRLDIERSYQWVDLIMNWMEGNGFRPIYAAGAREATRVSLAEMLIFRRHTLMNVMMELRNHYINPDYDESGSMIPPILYPADELPF